MKNNVYAAALKNMKYYIKNKRFLTVKMENLQKLGVCRSILEREGIVRGKGNNWFYTLDNGFMTYYFCK